MRAEEQPSPGGQLLCANVVASGDKPNVVASGDKPNVGGNRLDRRISNRPALARTRRTMP